MSVFKHLIYVCSYPPCSLAGAPIIAKQLLRKYPREQLTIVCDKAFYKSAIRQGRDTLLPCRHLPVSQWWPFDIRPRRIWAKWRDAVNALRVWRISQLISDAANKAGAEAIFAPFGHCEFVIAAFLAHKRTGIPLYVFETDDWVWSSSVSPVPAWLARRFQKRILDAASKVWLTSPAMVKDYRSRFGIEGSFLFNFIDIPKEHPNEESTISSDRKDEIIILYTGAINSMFHSTFAKICDWVNRGMCIDGRWIKLRIFSGADCTKFVGKHVEHRGQVIHSEIPAVLRTGDILLVAISFSEDRAVRRLVKTSLYTKTIDYLEAGRPVLVMGPLETAEVQYFGEVTHTVDRCDEEEFRKGVGRLVYDEEYRRDLVERGRAFVKNNHGQEALRRSFLDFFLSNELHS